MASPDQYSTDQESGSNVPVKVDIHKLAKYGNKEEIEMVLRDRRQERDIDERDQRGMTPLQYAVINNRPEVVEMLLKETTGKEKKSADYMIVDENGLSLAHYAAKTVRGKTRHAHDICIEGVTESRSDASSSFSSHDRTYCLNLLIKKDKDENGDKAELIYIQDKNHGQTALHYAVMSGSIRSVESLIDADTNRSKKQLIHTPDSNGMRPLHVAATYNQRDIAERLLEKGAELSTQDKTKSTALHYACSNGNLAMVELLLNKATKKGTINNLLNIGDNGENTCLHIAAESGHDAIVKLLLKNDATVLKTRRDGMLPLHVAVIGGKTEIVEAILGKSATWMTHDNANKARSTPLHLAAQYNRLKIAKLLIEKRNTSVNDRDKDLNTPLHIAAAHDRHRMVCLLMTNGADVHAKNTQGRIPLHGAAERNQLEALKELMRPENETKGKKFLALSDADRAKITKELQEVKEFDSSDKDLDVRPALEIVRKYLAKHGLLLDDREPGQRIYNIVRVLEFGKKWNDSMNGRKFSEQSRRSAGSRDSEKEGQPRRLLEREKTIVPKDNVDHLLRRIYMDNIINTEDESGNTALHLAAGSGHTKIVQCLLDDFHAEYDRKNDAESTALHLAAENGHHSTVEVIVKKYPNTVFAEDQNCNTPIHLAAMNGHKETMDILVRRGADVNQINSNKMTALDLAAKFGKVDICDSLVHLEAQNWVDKSRSDVSSLLLACEHGHLKVVKLLLKSASDFEIKNERGLNCLDVAVENKQREVARHIINSPHWKVALKNSVPLRPGSKKIVTPMRRLIRCMPEVALDVLDKCSEKRKDPDKKEKDPTKSEKKPKYKYNFQFVDDLMTEDGWSFTEPKREKYDKKKKEIKWTSYCQKARIIKHNHPLYIMVKHKREDLLQHHLVNQLIKTKWWHYGAYYYLVTFLIHLFFLILLTRYILQTKPPHLYSETDAANILDDKCDALSTNVELNNWLPIEKFLMYFLMILGTVFEVIQMYNMKAAYLNNLESYVEWVVYILSFLFLLESNDCTIKTGYRQEWQWSLGAFAIFFVWIDLVLYLKAFTSLGIYVIMFQLVCWTFLKVFLVFFSLITAFALAFHTLVQNKISFRDVANSILKTSVMFIGELDYEALFNDGVEDGKSTLLYPPAVSVLFSIFIIVASIVLMNLLVGLAVDDIKGILLKAAFKRTAMHIELVLDVEKVMNDWLRRKHYQKRDAENKTESESESKALWLWRKLKYSQIWWWNQKVDKDENAVLLTIPERQDQLEKSMESLTKQISDLTKILKPLIQDGNASARSAVTQEHKHNGK